MKFEYSRWFCKPTDAFPDKHSVLRPVIDIALKYGNHRVRVGVLLDTGADHCLFHESLRESLGIPLDEGKEVELTGATGRGIAHYHEVTLEIGGWSHKCVVGFIQSLDDLNFDYGILGHDGFFDQYKAIFDYRKETIEIKKHS